MLPLESQLLHFITIIAIDLSEHCLSFKQVLHNMNQMLTVFSGSNIKLSCNLIGVMEDTESRTTIQYVRCRDALRSKLGEQK